MQKLFRLFAVTFLAFVLAVGPVWADPGRDSGDPESPDVIDPDDLPLFEQQGHGEQPDLQAKQQWKGNRSVAVEEQRNDWMRILNAYLRMVRWFSF